MGFSISWIAIREKPQDFIHTELGLRPTGEREEIPESSCTATDLGNGWYVVFYNEGCQAVEDYARGMLEQDCEAVTCYVEEHVMCSGAAYWKAGQQVWSMAHAADDGMYHLREKGNLPDQYLAIRERLIQEQDENGGKKSKVDHIFDVPIELAKAITGFRHDLCTDEEDPWEVLEILEPAKKAGCMSILLIGGATWMAVEALTQMSWPDEQRRLTFFPRDLEERQNVLGRDVFLKAL